MIRAEIIAVGSEMLTPFRSDTNSLFLTRSLEECGIRVVAKSIIGDDMNSLVNAFRIAFDSSDVIICSGGLGPTVDDLTRDALAAYLEVPLELDEKVLDDIRARFKRYGWSMPENNRQQAMVPAGAHVLPNPNGSAPGIYMEARGKQIFLLPGPPHELEAMWENEGLPRVRKGDPLVRRIYRIAMMGESRVDDMLSPVSRDLKDVQYTILASPSEIEVHLFAPKTAGAELDRVDARVREILGKHIYADRYESLEAAVGRLLKERGKTVAIAESCTGGLLGHRLTQVAGSSAYFLSGVTPYSNEMKTKLLDVPADTIARHGAVSEPTATAMAESIRRISGADYGIAITGIAGPDGGSEEKPVGTVFVAIADERGTDCQRFHFPGKRDRVKFSSTQAALNLLRLRLINHE